METGNRPTPDALRPTIIRCLVLNTRSRPTCSGEVPTLAALRAMDAGGRRTGTGYIPVVVGWCVLAIVWLPTPARSPVLTTGDAPAGTSYQPGFSPYKHTLLKLYVFDCFSVFLIID